MCHTIELSAMTKQSFSCVRYKHKNTILKNFFPNPMKVRPEGAKLMPGGITASVRELEALVTKRLHWNDHTTSRALKSQLLSQLCKKMVKGDC